MERVTAPPASKPVYCIQLSCHNFKFWTAVLADGAAIAAAKRRHSRAAPLVDITNASAAITDIRRLDGTDGLKSLRFSRSVGPLASATSGSTATPNRRNKACCQGDIAVRLGLNN